MGIADWYEVIKSICPDVFVTLHLSQLAGISLATDISIFLNKFVKTAGTERWLESFIYLLCAFKRNGIKPVNIFDGPNPPIEKRQEQERRRAEGAKKQERINEGKKLIKKLEKKAMDEQEITESEADDAKAIIGKKRGKHVDTTNYEDIYDVISALKTSVRKQEIQNLPILKEYSAKAKEIIDIMGFPSFQAEGEAETLCAALACLGLVDGVLSEDTDVTVYGTPYFFAKLDLKEQTVVVSSHEAILEGLEMDHEEFRDLCILLSCDYNERVKGYPPDGKKRKKPVGIGAKGALQMIQEYRRLEEAEKYMEDADPLNYRRCRELFTPPTELPDISIPYNKPIDEERLRKFLVDNNIKMNINYILDTWKPSIKLNFVRPEDDIVEEEIESDEELFQFENKDGSEED